MCLQNSLGGGGGAGPFLAQSLSDQVLQCLLKDIEILAIILVPLIMTLSRGHTGQIKGQS